MSDITLINQEKYIPIDALCHALEMPRATYYRHQKAKTDKAIKKPTPPKNALKLEEKQIILDLLHSEKFVDRTPYEVFNTLIDDWQYYCSTRTMYRALEAHGETQDRRSQRNHRDAVKPELIATRANGVWSWDITKLKSFNKWNYFYLYVILDIYSRYVVGWLIAERESQDLARQLIHECALKQGIQPNQLSLHSDNGPVMKAHIVSQLLEHLGIIKTHNRPYTSNDNPFSESQFKTLKYCPDFPVQFADIDAAEKFCQKFFSWYNNEHFHSGISWLTPTSVHNGSSAAILEKRFQVMLKAYYKNPVRFNNKIPKLKILPPAVYINPPASVKINIDNLEKKCG
jgi:transposase InsO family protein